MATSLETHRRPPTSDQLRTLHAQLSQCAATARDAADFFNRFLTAAVGTIGAAGGAAWSAEPAGFRAHSRQPEWIAAIPPERLRQRTCSRPASRISAAKAGWPGKRRMLSTR